MPPKSGKPRDYKAEYARRKAKAAKEGRSLRSARGHGNTPNSPLEALRHPDRYPDYVATHYKQLNTLARKRGQGEIVGIGPKGIEGEKAAEDRVREGKRPMSDWTYMAKENPEDHDYRFGYAYRTKREAQEFARASGASPGTVIVWRNPGTGLYEVYFQELSPKQKKKGRKRRWSKEALKKYNRRKKHETGADKRPNSPGRRPKRGGGNPSGEVPTF